MSLKSYGSYSEDYERSKALKSTDAGVRRRAKAARSERLDGLREKAKSPSAPPAVHREEDKLYDPKLVRLKIGHPSPTAERLHVVLIDNSGSNRKIAQHLRKTSGYLLATLGSLDPESQLAVVYFSDHCDGRLIEQHVDWVSPGEEGDKILHSTTLHVKPAGGGDAPEAIECAMWNACDIDFGSCAERHLYLVTDVVAHGMGMSSDNGCPLQREWQQSLERVRETFTSFEVVGCGSDPKVGVLQQQFIAEDRLAYDLIDLSNIKSHGHRTGITGNAFLFLVARHRGLQEVEMFLMGIYEKWLAEPIFGANTDMGAREAILRFGKYLEAPEARIGEMMNNIFD